MRKALEEISLSQSCPPDVTASMVAVDRAAGELRRNSAVIIDDDRGAVLAQAAETVTAESLAALLRLSKGNVSLALTARRASVLKLVGAAAGIVTLPIADTTKAALVRYLIDPTCPAPDGTTNALIPSPADRWLSSPGRGDAREARPGAAGGAGGAASGFRPGRRGAAGGRAEICCASRRVPSSTTRPTSPRPCSRSAKPACRSASPRTLGSSGSVRPTAAPSSLPS